MPVSNSLSTTVAPSKVAFAPTLVSTIPADITSSPTRPKHHKRSSGSDVHVNTNPPMQRSISTPVAASASMVTTEQVADFERQRQSQVMMTAYISSSIREKKQGNPIPYEELIAQLTVSKPVPRTPAKLLQWIQAMSQCISLLDKSCISLIDAMLQIDWIVQDDNFVQHYLSFLGNAVSAHAVYVVPVQSMLVKRLTTRYKVSPSDNTLDISRERQYDRVHQALKYILNLIPTGSTTLFPLLAAEFPHKRESINAHVTYVKNILKVLEYAPVLRTQVLGVVIDRIIQVDVEIQVELEELEDSDTEVVYDFDMNDKANEDEEESDDDDDDSGSDSGSDSDSESGAEVAVLNIKDMTQKLDGMLFLVFSYLEQYVNSCQDLTAMNGEVPLPIQELFLVLLSIFMKTILQTFKSRHTQFLLFYCISLSPQFSDYFLGALGQQILDKSQPQVIRVAAAAYMSSFVARAKYLDLRQVGMVVDMLGGFALGTIEEVDTGSNVVPDPERHAVFYAVVQALMYIFCFRWKVLVIGGSKQLNNRDDFDSAGMIVGSMDGAPGPNSELSATRQWHSGLASLQRIITSRLNPLKICSGNVVKQFARISNNLDFMYVYPILEQNKKTFIHRRYSPASIPGSDSNGANANGQVNGGILPQELETFFPFDPYRLRQSATFMNGIYQEWEDDEDDDDEEEEEEEEEEEGEEEEDELNFVGRHSPREDIEEEEDEDEEDEATMKNSIMAMSISPSPAHFLVQGMTSNLASKK